jgi:hypothetical protein
MRCWCPLCTRPTRLVGFYGATALKQQSADRHLAPHDIICIYQLSKRDIKWLFHNYIPGKINLSGAIFWNVVFTFTIRFHFNTDLKIYHNLVLCRIMTITTTEGICTSHAYCTGTVSAGGSTSLHDCRRTCRP